MDAEEIKEIIALVDTYDLPDGAYWAMLEEMTGLEPAELVEYMDGE